jgi:hypothetical protein
MACHNPILIQKYRNTTNEALRHVKTAVPCGKCPSCLLSKSAEWTVRLYHEEKSSKNSYFLTLTYAPEFYPGYLRKDHLQKLFKRYRIAAFRKYGYSGSLSPSEFKYYAIGEYGERTNRAHYHAILFNVDIVLLCKKWEYGYKYVGRAQKESINYCTSYVIAKKRFGGHKFAPPFSIMSKGLGLSYINNQIIQFHNERKETIITLPSGEKYNMPQYLREKIFKDKNIIKDIGERNRINARIDLENTERSEVIAKRNYERIRYSRKAKVKL